MLILKEVHLIEMTSKKNHSKQALTLRIRFGSSWSHEHPMTQEFQYCGQFISDGG